MMMDHSRRLINGLKEENKKLKSEISLLRSELENVTARYDAVINIIDEATDAINDAKKAKREAEAERDNYRKLFSECLSLKKEYNKKAKKIISDIKKNTI